MVLQLSLGNVVDNYDGLVRALDTVTGFSGVEIRRQSVILTPRFPYDPPEQAGQINQVQSHKMRLTRLWDESLGAFSLLKDQQTAGNGQIWTIQLSDIPIAGDNLFTNQNIQETTICQSDDIFGYLDELGYKTETEFWVRAKRWYWGDVIVEVSETLVQDREVEGEGEPKGKVNIKPLGGKRLVRAMVNVLNMNDIESINRGKRQLEALKKELHEIVHLVVPDRSSMDSRVGSKLATAGMRGK